MVQCPCCHGAGVLKYRDETHGDQEVTTVCLHCEGRGEVEAEEGET